MARNLFDELITEENLIRIRGWARDGLTNEQIAKNLDITAKTLYEWCKKSSELSNALKKTKEIVDREVENSLYKKTQGFFVQVKKIFKLKDVIYNENGKKIKETEKLVTGYDEQYIPPDTTAQIYWLNNRMSDKWRNKHDISVDGEDLSDREVRVKVEMPTAEDYERVKKLKENLFIND